jgi:hypothetical protein
VSNFDVTDDGWLPARGDYGTHYADQVIQLIEARNCVQGCTHAGTLAAVREHGPGGTCHLLALVGLPERVKGFEHDGGVTTADQTGDHARWGDIPAGTPAPLCTERTPRPGPVRRGPRKRHAVLFEVTA